jgi:hypothetical protein
MYVIFFLINLLPLSPITCAVYPDFVFPEGETYRHNVVLHHAEAKPDEEHEFPLSDGCAKYREIPMDARYFGQIPDQVKGVEDIRNVLKHAERPFNLLKNREGLSHLKITSQQIE